MGPNTGSTFVDQLSKGLISDNCESSPHVLLKFSNNFTIQTGRPVGDNFTSNNLKLSLEVVKLPQNIVTE